MVGVNPVMVGAAAYVKAARLAVPLGVVTDTLPVEPFAGTADIEVALITANEAAAVPPKLTAVAPVKLVPVMVTVVPDVAVEGVKEVMEGTVALK
jgi:hypothetical protein